jgi:hypothetical protein
MENQQSQDADAIAPEIVESDSLPKEVDKKSNNLTVRTSTSIRRGPIPPGELSEYEKLVPGFAARYLEEVFNGAEHQRRVDLAEIEQEKRILEAQLEIFNKNHERSLSGTRRGFIAIMAALIFATILGIQGQEKVAIAIVASLAGVSAIIYGTDAYNKGKMEKLEQKKDDKENILE